MTKQLAEELVKVLAEGNYKIYLTPAGRLAITELLHEKGTEQDV
ncbi:hypothetical protein BpOF4_04530 [Alkalihalophilus pseudofirmus OF4]|uniref:Uncharacterized protein n=1 Tax=Alkalihalophilus pseudofirmus (strain ATCC BAA-2126 / JCM 17055 / OF4) TaxID=398511 RepID=D3FYT7_ALKPO|nr:hypothetical protein [Alkalihalophilus pseudofirmus]ADC48970.1 hypothetical protein BpOF4_04530 [Alkalihalophilus pseudofirmus OF4]